MLGWPALVALLLALPVPAWSHALAPSLLEVFADDGPGYAVRWKTPLKRAPGSQLRPVLPDHCTALEQARAEREGTGVITTWRVDCGEAGLVGSTIRVQGIAGSRADVILRVALDDGRVLHRVLKPGQERYVVPAREPWYRIFQAYAVMGIEHLVGGIDHVLFVIALFMLVGLHRSLIWTVTMFTVGHSVTLSLAVLGFIRFPQAVAETFIALSIIIALAEVLTHPRQDLTHWKVYLMAGGFGLLHGLGFAGALEEVGLPEGDIPLALLSFNVGIELGQLALIGVLCLLTLVLQRLGLQWRGLWRQLPVYAAGTVAGFWFWQRLLLSLA